MSRTEDLALLDDVLALDDLDQGGREAFLEMRHALAERPKRGGLTDKQRAWARDVLDARKPRYENLVSAGKVPIGKPVEINVGPKVLRPPHRRHEVA